ncbi:MAG: hypothetical protein EBR82_61245 [Caulobacteraceae bacterium]|nr:hypothetical protein [Caulobacteraceae bacterium]
MDRKTARDLDRWLTDDARDFGPADAPDPTPTPDAAAIDAASRNALETRRAALAERLLQSIGPSWDDVELAVWAFDRHRESRSAERLAELIIDLMDDAL